MEDFESFLLEEEGRYLKLNDIGAYRIAFNLSNFVWDKVVNWNYFEKDTVGKQSEYKHIFSELEKLPREINYLIKFTNEKLEY
jgi:hypothetical protein